MASAVTRLISEADRDRIRKAVAEAEQKTSGEIVPYIVEQSDTYESAEWRGGAMAGIIVATAFAALHELTPIWLPLNFAGLVIVTIVACVAGMLLVRFVPPLKRLLAGGSEMDHRVSGRAAEAFIAEEVFKTRDRTGILLFVSLMEHRVLVIGDAGINAKVEKRDWDGVVSTVIDGIRSRALADGLIGAIGLCGELLHRQGVKRRTDDSDELSDRLRIGDR
jgi:putative membrane protein